MNEFLELEEKIVRVLKTVFDPEIPVDIYELGLIYNIDINDGEVIIEMTLTAPNCPAADFILEDVKQKVEGVEGVKSRIFIYNFFSVCICQNLFFNSIIFLKSVPCINCYSLTQNFISEFINTIC